MSRWKKMVHTLSLIATGIFWPAKLTVLLRLVILGHKRERLWKCSKLETIYFIKSRVNQSCRLPNNVALPLFTSLLRAINHTLTGNASLVPRLPPTLEVSKANNAWRAMRWRITASKWLKSRILMPKTVGKNQKTLNLQINRKPKGQLTNLLSPWHRSQFPISRTSFLQS